MPHKQRFERIQLGFQSPCAMHEVGEIRCEVQCEVRCEAAGESEVEEEGKKG